MIATLYKGDPRIVREFPSEFYELSVKKLHSGKTFRYFLTELHGWWDGGALQVQTTFCPQDGYDSSGEAEQRFQTQKLHRVKEGFIHCFTVDLLNSGDPEYTKIAAPTA